MVLMPNSTTCAYLVHVPVSTRTSTVCVVMTFWKVLKGSSEYSVRTVVCALQQLFLGVL